MGSYKLTDCIAFSSVTVLFNSVPYSVRFMSLLIAKYNLKISTVLKTFSLKEIRLKTYQTNNPQMKKNALGRSQGLKN